MSKCDEFDQIVAETAPDADGWIEWKGGECPVCNGLEVDVRFRCGEVTSGKSAGAWQWGHGGWRHDIIAYRLHKPEHAEPQHSESVTRSIPEPATKPTLDQLLQDWRNADDYAQRKQAEADEAAAMRDDRWQAVQARAGEMGVTVGRCEPVVVGEPELVITDWRDLRAGDKIECLDGTWCAHLTGEISTVIAIEGSYYDGDMPIHAHANGVDDWGDNFRFIRRP